MGKGIQRESDRRQGEPDPAKDYKVESQEPGKECPGHLTTRMISQISVPAPAMIAPHLVRK